MIAIKDTKVKQVGNELKKDKTLEHDKKADQRKATPSTDAFDKGCYWLNEDKRNGIFLEVKV